MANKEEFTDIEARGLKIKELEIRISHYKYYITAALQANVFFYVTTGGVIAYYLKYTHEAKIPHLEFFLLLPILLGSVLGGVFFYGAWLQATAVEHINDVRDEFAQHVRFKYQKASRCASSGDPAFAFRGRFFHRRDSANICSVITGKPVGERSPGTHTISLSDVV